MYDCVYILTIYCTALAVYTRSPAAYAALKSFHILQLPSVSTLKAFTGNNIENPGEVEKRLHQCHRQYHYHKEEVKEHGGKEPLGEGVLIIDEVKVWQITLY